jgi:hypothetical protein
LAFQKVTTPIGVGTPGHFTLHGLSNWIAGPAGERILVMGGNKAITINQFPLLTRFRTEFQRLINVGVRG